MPQWTSYHLHNNLAIFYFKKGDFKNSIKKFDEAWNFLSCMEKKSPMMNQTLVHLNYNMAEAYRQSKEPGKAMEHYTEASKMASITYGEDHIFVGSIGLELDKLNKERIMEESAEN